MCVWDSQPDSAGRQVSPLTADEMEYLLTQGASATRAPLCLYSSVHLVRGSSAGLDLCLATKVPHLFIWSLIVKILFWSFLEGSSLQCWKYAIKRDQYFSLIILFPVPCYTFSMLAAHQNFTVSSNYGKQCLQRQHKWVILSWIPISCICQL